MLKKRIAKLLVALTVTAPVALVGMPAAAAPSPTPNGYCGALNMLQDPTMVSVAMAHASPQGVAGMFNAVAHSDCG